MKQLLFVASAVIALGCVSAPSVSAQGVYVSPGGVGVDLGGPRYRDYDRPRYRERGYGYGTYDQRPLRCRTIIEYDGPYVRKTRVCR